MPLSFDEQMQNFADLTVRYGVGLVPGRRLLVRAPVDSAPFTRAVVRAAYRAGAPMVEVLWHDDDLSLARFQEAPSDSFDELPNLGFDALIAAGANAATRCCRSTPRIPRFSRSRIPSSWPRSSAPPRST